MNLLESWGKDHALIYSSIKEINPNKYTVEATDIHGMEQMAYQTQSYLRTGTQSWGIVMMTQSGAMSYLFPWCVETRTEDALPSFEAGPTPTW